uniref:Disintegrin and metalloproteinase domain-containing protein 11 n=1 Tax=Lygus hesperus TaxID=30085 RepID=A0A0K8T3Q2_LYGHE
MRLASTILLVHLAATFVQSSPAKREADYTLDDSFWNEENPVGEVERLLLEYRQNQELVRNIGAHYYQIIYPVQLRHHEKMGISTREVGAPKFPPREGGNAQSGYGNTSRSRSRVARDAIVSRETGKHFHRTSLLIKAFNHKFRLDLELNTQLLAPNLMQKHYLPSGAEQVSKQIEHCYYHGTVKDYPGATAAFHTCNGVSGVIHVGNETFVIHPFYGGDLSKHPHVIFEARTKANKGCGLQGNTDWRTNTYRRTKHVSGGRFARDVSEATKYIETALVIDKAMFEKRNGSTRSEVVHDAIQVANIADLYFRTLNTRVSVVYIETWQDRNHASIEKGDDIGKALLNFIDYSSRQLYRVDKDTTQLLTGDNFKGGEAGISVPDVVCTPKSVGISVDVNPYELHLLAGTMAHMIGHNIGMSHDGGREECVCRDWHGCIMAQTIVGQENVQPYKFSECSRTDYNSALRTGHGICLLNKPNELETKRTCGNGIVEDGEDCDCGQIHDCQDQECCDPYTCKLRKDAQCATGPCCKNCTLKLLGTVCREATNECDLPEHCTGDMGLCPPDIHKKNGIECDNGKAHCFNGLCPTLNAQCDKIWGFGAKAGDLECFTQFNSKGSFNGHCGTDSEKNFIKCDNENARCGSLQCQHGSSTPQIAIDQHQYSTTIISIKGQEYECKTTSPTEKGHVQFSGLVWDGTPCGTNLICVNQTCTSLYPHVGTGKCPSNDNNVECSGNGVCSNINKCYCELGYEGPDCSQIGEYNPPILDTTQAPSGGIGPTLEDYMKKKETPYGQNSDNLSTLMMVFIMVGVVKCVFICFASIAVCYRRTTMPKPDPPFIKKPGIAPKGLPAMASAPVQESPVLDNSTMLSFGNMPSYRSGVRVSECRTGKCRHNWDDSLSCSSCELLGLKREHKMQQMKRLGVGSGSEDDPGHSEETVSFIDLPPNNLSKLPEKGILKKPCPFGGEDPCHKGKWLDDAQSDAQEMLSQSGDNLGADMLSSGPISEVAVCMLPWLPLHLHY